VSELLARSQLPLDGVPATLDHFFVATRGEQIVGVAGLEMPRGATALLRSVAVDAGERNTGIASRLVNRVIAHAGSARVTSIYLLTTTAAEYFARRGFQLVDRTSVPASLRETAEFTHACPASAVAMVLDVANAPARD
jgi:amino-acid N-acetyltransferase